MSRGASTHRIDQLPILVLFPHNRCNCRCVMCDIWKIREVREITDTDLAPHVSGMTELGVKWIVLSGGEPLMHSDLPALCGMLRREGIRLTLLTAGLSIEEHALSITRLFDDVIVSIDGPIEVHDRIRGVPGAFRHLNDGVRALRRLRPEIPVHGRCTVQKQNFRKLGDTVRAAHALKLSSLSFLAADLTSSAFNRPDGWTAQRQAHTALNPDETEALGNEIEALEAECRPDFQSGFILESPEKLGRIVRHFRAALGQVGAVAPRCNAPWVSAVIEADGSVRPCFFHSSIGNIHDHLLPEILNGEEALEFRRELDVATNATCRNCVCSLYVPEETDA